MERFNLDQWLKDKSRKVVTRDGRPVRIICWDKENTSSPIVFLIKDSEEGCSYEYINCADIEGNADIMSDDIFFADEEDELTEFEKELRYWIGQSLCNYENNGCVSDNMSDSVNIYLKAASKKLLELARKELKEDWRTYLRLYKNGYEQGKEAGLKDLPKWKKANVFVSDEFGLATRDDDLIITWKGYQIKLSDLTTLPKEE